MGKYRIIFHVFREFHEGRYVHEYVPWERVKVIEAESDEEAKEKARELLEDWIHYGYPLSIEDDYIVFEDGKEVRYEIREAKPKVYHVSVPALPNVSYVHFAEIMSGFLSRVGVYGAEIRVLWLDLEDFKRAFLRWVEVADYAAVLEDERGLAVAVLVLVKHKEEVGRAFEAVKMFLGLFGARDLKRSEEEGKRFLEELKKAVGED